MRAWRERLARAPVLLAGVAFLPVVGTGDLGVPDPCARAAACAPPGWTVHCGGIGAVRDAFASEAGGSTVVDVVGDGAARFDARTRSWAVQLGADLGGLRALYLDTESGGWAVGERTRLARLAGSGCWEAEDAALGGPSDLRSVVFDGATGEGWAVGARRDSGVLLRLAGGRWSDATSLLGGAPRLVDFYLDPRPSVAETWFVSDVAGALLHGRLGRGDGASPLVEVDARVPLADRDGRPALPREIALDTAGSGWVVGDSAESGVVAWRHRGGLDWRVDTASLGGLAGRQVVDLYFAATGAPGRWWLGLTPDERGDGVLRLNEGADASTAWTHWDATGPPDARSDAVGHAAIAPLRFGDLLYATGDRAWTYAHERMTWIPVLSRRRLAGVAPHAAGGWVLASGGSEPDGGGLLALAAGGLRPLETEMPPLAALASGGGAAWAVGGSGAAWRQRGARGSWSELSVPGAPDLVDVAVEADGDAWAVGTAVGGRGGAWRLGAGRDSWVRLADVAEPLRAVAALADRAWAVGRGVACSCDASACACEEDLRYAPRPGGDPITLDFRAVAAAGDGPGDATVWASGDFGSTSYLVRRGASDWRQAPAALPSGLPQGARVVDLVAAAPDDFWAAAVCRPYPELERGTTLVGHFDGRTPPGAVVATSEALALPIPVRSLAVGGTTAADAADRTLWIAGDWSTLLALAYRPPAPTHAPPVPDRRCLPAGPRGQDQ